MRSAGVTRFYGWTVVWAAFVVAVFGWGLGFYGPPIYLQAVHVARGWPVALVSAAVTTHFLVGAVVVANLPALYRRFGLALVTQAGAVLLALGVCGWAWAEAPWQLFAATVLSGAGWVALGAAAINAMVAPWFVRGRPAALAMAYNGASVGGVVFSPLWVAAIAALGFAGASALIGLVMVVAVTLLAQDVIARTPAGIGVLPDGDLADAGRQVSRASGANPLPGRMLWRDRRFVTLAAGMSLGLFAQIGLIAHLFSLLVPALGAGAAGLAMGGATVCAIAGRTSMGWLLPKGADRRLAACANYGIQMLGCAAFIASGGHDVPLLLAGVALFGVGIGNATSLPPLIAQVDFGPEDVGRAVALITAASQASYAFAPAVFGAIREATDGASPTAFYATAAVFQALAIASFLAGRRPAAGSGPIPAEGR
jgi:MFS family permease